MASRKFVFSLDIKVDEDLITAIEQKANGGPVSKALYRIIQEWYNASIINSPNSSQLESNNSLDSEFKDIFS